MGLPIWDFICIYIYISYGILSIYPHVCTYIYIWIMNHRSDRWDAHPSREPSLATCGFEAIEYINVMIRAAKSIF